MGEVLQKLESSEALRTRLVAWAPGCFVCAWILQDLRENKRLTGWPFDVFGKPDLPVDAKLTHLFTMLPERPPEDPETDEAIMSLLAGLSAIE